MPPKPSIHGSPRGGTEEIRPRFYCTNGGSKVLTHISVAFRLLFSAHNTTFTWSLAGEPSATVALCSETGFLGHVGIGVDLNSTGHSLNRKLSELHVMDVVFLTWMRDVYLHSTWFLKCRRVHFQFKIVV